MGTQLAVSEYCFSAPIPEKLCFAFISDLHCCNNDPILEKLAEISPDAVLVGGDFIHSNIKYEEGFDFLRRSAACYPTFCSIGNHELRFQGDLHEAIRETGVTCLDNAFTDFHGVLLGGLTSALREQRIPNRFLLTQVPDLGFLYRFSRAPGYKLLLCHHPEYYPKYIRPLPIDLMLAGHAHGGQIRFFDHALYAPGQGIFPKYTGGIHENRMIVGRGLGNTAFFPRINNDPEIVLIRLAPSSENPA